MLNAIKRVPAGTFLVPMIVFRIASGDGMDWMPVLSTIIPMVAGVAFGNLDPNFRGLFMPALPALTVLMGWNLGYGMNLVEAFQAGVAGFIVTIIFYMLSLLFVFIDRNLLGNDGSVGATFMTVAGLSVSTAAILGNIYPDVLGEYVTAAASEVLMAVVITSVITPTIVAKLSTRNNKLT